MKGICHFYPEGEADFVQIHNLILLYCLHLQYLQEETLPFPPLSHPPLSSSTSLQIIKLPGNNYFGLWQVLNRKKPFFISYQDFPTDQVILGL